MNQNMGDISPERGKDSSFFMQDNGVHLYKGGNGSHHVNTSG